MSRTVLTARSHSGEIALTVAGIGLVSEYGERLDASLRSDHRSLTKFAGLRTGLDVVSLNCGGDPHSEPNCGCQAQHIALRLCR